MTDDEKNQVYKLFQKYDTIFPKHPLDLWHTSKVKHYIKLHNKEPFKEPYRPISSEVFNEVREHMKDMLDMAAIKESTSTWSSNCVIVRKKVQFDFASISETASST